MPEIESSPVCPYHASTTLKRAHLPCFLAVEGSDHEGPWLRALPTHHPLSDPAHLDGRPRPNIELLGVVKMAVQSYSPVLHLIQPLQNTAERGEEELVLLGTVGHVSIGD